MKIKWFLLFTCMSAFLLTSVQAQAKTYRYQQHPITLKESGQHITIRSYQILDHPEPSYSYDDTNEVAAYLLVHMTASLNSRYDDNLTLYSSDFELLSGPNATDVLSKDDKISRLLSVYPKIMTREHDGFKVKNGHSRNFDVAFQVYPNNRQTLIVSMGLLNDNQRIILHDVKTTNGVTAD